MRHVIAAILLTGTAVAVAAADLAVMSAGALEAGMMQLAAEFGRGSGHAVRVDIGNAPQLTARLAAGDTADVLIAPANVMDQAAADGRIVPASRTNVGRVGVAVVVPAGAPAPDISSPDALRRALLAAGAIVYNQGSSGTYIQRLLSQLGIAGEVGRKTVRVLNGEAVTERIAGGRATDIAFVASPDAIRGKGLRYVGPLPAPLQNFTAYDGAVMNKAREPTAAAEFLRYIGSASGRRMLREAGVE
jgi:molybdate transport system substrate-binding protein